MSKQPFCLQLSIHVQLLSPIVDTQIFRACAERITKTNYLFYALHTLNRFVLSMNYLTQVNKCMTILVKLLLRSSGFKEAM